MGTADRIATEALISCDFAEAYDRFQELMHLESGHHFVDFDEGLMGGWESYKPALRDNALNILDAQAWHREQIGSGKIIERMTAAIEMDGSGAKTNNNLVRWQNINGHANRDHRVLIDARTDVTLCEEVERLLFSLYHDEADDEQVFDRLAELSGPSYTLMAYLFFLKDINRFMPIRTSRYDQAFKALGIDFKTVGRCSWENYTTYNAILDGLRPLIARTAKLDDVRLIDAHSFCWVLSELIKAEAKGKYGETRHLASAQKASGSVYSYGARERWIYMNFRTLVSRAKHSNDQTVETTVKNKELHLSELEHKQLMNMLHERQDGRCALSGLPLEYERDEDNFDLVASVDRIDSNDHYNADNVQLVCTFINLWKGARTDSEFLALLNLVRRIEPAD